MSTGMREAVSFITAALGDVVAESAMFERALWFRFRSVLSSDLRSNLRAYVALYNKVHGTKLVATFPKRFRMRLADSTPQSR